VRSTLELRKRPRLRLRGLSNEARSFMWFREAGLRLPLSPYTARSLARPLQTSAWRPARLQGALTIGGESELVK